MFDRLQSILLRLLRVPPEPEPPAGAPESVRVFRAGRNYLSLRLTLWAVGQSLALAGIIFWFWVLHRAEVERDRGRALAPPTSVAAEPAPDGRQIRPLPTEGIEKSPGKRTPRRVKPGGDWRRAAARTPDWVFHLLLGLKVIGVGAYLVQLPITYAIRRLDYAQRWYVVTDRSLRLRTGIWSMREITMSFANLQQVVVTQGPLQRLLHLADVRVQSAGGGGSAHPGHGGATAPLHTGDFHAVDNAEEIRDLIVERLRRFRETGLGDPDEKRQVAPMPAQAPMNSATLAAARELLAEARMLRQVLG
ncbi:MAG: PH domain-containing protein [Pedosphaera sp.]|nr:PH domain-containing protein [Pedosphaera sp.]